MSINLIRCETLKQHRIWYKESTGTRVTINHQLQQKQELPHTHMTLPSDTRDSYKTYHQYHTSRPNLVVAHEQYLTILEDSIYSSVYQQT